MSKRRRTKKTKKATTKTFQPVSSELTPYGAKKFRTPVMAREFVGTRGQPVEAVILDIDGTLQDWGGTVAEQIAEFCARHYKADRVLIVITARVQEYEYKRSFDWLVSHVPYPFIGPFCRSNTDPRYASEFKRELAQGFEDMGLYRIVGAADDNLEVNDMWKQWAVDHFKDPKDFDLLECNYASYTDWRKGASQYAKDTYAYWPKNRPAGTSHYSPTTSPIQSWGRDPVDGVWKSAASFIEPARPGDNISDDWRWTSYLYSRAKAGAYVDKANYVLVETPDPDEIEPDYGLDRAEWETLALHAHPHLTPEDLEEMDNQELRSHAGITHEDYVQMLYDAIAQKFSHRYAEGELDELSLDQLEELLSLDQDDADAFVTSLDDEVSGKAMWSSDSVQNARIQQRMDLEDDVLASCEDLTYDQVYNMDVRDLEDRLAKARQPEQLAIIEALLPPVGAEGEAECA